MTQDVVCRLLLEASSSCPAVERPTNNRCSRLLKTKTLSYMSGLRTDDANEPGNAEYAGNRKCRFGFGLELQCFGHFRWSE